MKLTPDSRAIAFARRVLPQPGGPTMRMPGGFVKLKISHWREYFTGARMAVFNSSRTFWRAPMSSHDTSGTVAKPSRLLDGCTRFIAILILQIRIRFKNQNQFEIKNFYDNNLKKTSKSDWVISMVWFCVFPSFNSSSAFLAFLSFVFIQSITFFQNFFYKT